MFLLFLIISIIFIAVAGMSEAIMDKVQFHWHKSIFPYNPRRYPESFWNPYHSWKNKYSDNTYSTPKFPGSTSIFVFATDAWHLFKFIRNLSTSISIMTALISMSYYSLGLNPIIGSILLTSILRVIYGISFTVFFNKFLQFKNIYNINLEGNTPGNEVNSDWMKKVNGEL